MDLSNEKTFEHFFLFCFFMGLIYCGVALYVLKRKGVDIRTNKVIIGVSLTSLPIGFLPFWLKANLSWQFKIFVPLISTVIGIAYSFVVMRAGKKLRKLVNPTNNE
jgi:hypothetical protein